MRTWSGVNAPTTVCSIPWLWNSTRLFSCLHISMCSASREEARQVSLIEDYLIYKNRRVLFIKIAKTFFCPTDKRRVKIMTGGRPNSWCINYTTQTTFHNRRQCYRGGRALHRPNRIMTPIRNILLPLTRIIALIHQCIHTHTVFSCLFPACA